MIGYDGRRTRTHLRPAGSCRTHVVTLVTTLLDAESYSTEALAALYGQRRPIDAHLRHLKQTFGMDMPRPKSVASGHKELAIFSLLYNLVWLVMLRAAERQPFPLFRISFIDALR